MPASERLSGESSVMLAPLNSMVPEVVRYTGSPMMTWPSVDFPAPLGPMSTWHSPLPSVRETSCRMGFSSALAETPLMLRRCSIVCPNLACRTSLVDNTPPKVGFNGLWA